MAITTVQVKSADDLVYDVVGETIGGKFYPIYKLAVGSAEIDSTNPVPTQILDASGNLISTVVDPQSGNNSLGVAALQDVYEDPDNSSTVNLASGATFTGLATNCLTRSGIRVFFNASVAVGTCTCTVFVDQSSDGTNWDITDEFIYVDTKPFSQPVATASKFYRVRITNNSETITDSFRLAAKLVPVANTLPRALDERGNLKTSTTGLADQFGFEAQFSPMHSLQVAEPYRLVGSVFGASIDTNFWTATNTGTASASGVANSISTVSSGTANSGFGQMKSVRSGRFIFAHPMKFRGAFRVPVVAVAGATRVWGPVTDTSRAPQNGPYFSVSASGALSVNTASGGSVTSKQSGDFNGDVSQYILDTNVHAYEIVYFTAGAWFYIDGVFIHKFTPTTSILYKTLSNPINYWSTNSASGTTNANLECWNATILRLGRAISAPISKYISGATAGTVLKIGDGTVQKINLSMINNNSAITLYDNTAASGTVLWAFDSGNLDRAVSYDFGELSFSIGLTVVQTGVGSKITISYE